MIKVKNKKTINNLSKKSIKANRHRNIIAILAIALTALMFTSLFTIGGGMAKTFELSTCRQVGTISHAGYKYMTQKDYDAVKGNPHMKEISYNIFVGMGTNPELSKEQVEVRYSEEKSAKWGFNEPTTGTMPKEEKDLATSTIVLDALHIPHKLGEKVKLSYDVNVVEKTDTFRLCGYWESDSTAPAQEVWLSKEYVSKVAPTPTEPITTGKNGYEIAGYISSDIMFANSWNIEGKLDQLTEECGLNEDEVDTGVNWAYTTSTVDAQTVIIIVIIFFLIMLSGYLIIYNVFYISVARDIRYYGLLKTIGTTGKQIKYMVRKQAVLLAIPGIGAGLLIGWGIGNIMLPMLMKNFVFWGTVAYSANPIIFIGAGVFSLFTVYISCNKPAKIASKVSPIEALRSQEANVSKKTKKAHRVSEWTMAEQNVLRNKKKVCVVVLSLALSVILLNATYGMLKSFDMDLYLAQNIVADFNISNDILLNHYELTYVDEEVQKQVEMQTGINEIGYVYMEEYDHELSDSAWQREKELVQEYADEDSYLASCADMVNDNRYAISHLYGMSKFVFDKLDCIDGELDWEKFKSGDYVIVTPFAEIPGGYVDGYYVTGDTVTIDFENGTHKDYKVLAEADIPQPLTCLHSHIINEDFILPDTEYIANATEKQPMHICLDVEDDKESAIEDNLAQIRDNSDMDYTSKAQAIAEFEQELSMYRVVGGALAFILGLIGVLNFLNSMVTSIYTRRQELAMLQSVGMTTKQLKKMLMMEGVMYALFTIGFVLTIGTVMSYGLIQLVAGQTWFFQYHFSILPVVVCIPFLILIAMLVPYVCYHNVQKHSIVERLREAE